MKIRSSKFITIKLTPAVLWCVALRCVRRRWGLIWKLVWFGFVGWCLKMCSYSNNYFQFLTWMNFNWWKKQRKRCIDFDSFQSDLPQTFGLRLLFFCKLSFTKAAGEARSDDILFVVCVYKYIVVCEFNAEKKEANEWMELMEKAHKTNVLLILIYIYT